MYIYVNDPYQVSMFEIWIFWREEFYLVSQFHSLGYSKSRRVLVFKTINPFTIKVSW